ncbi:solute carrier organic anion transporter family member 3A1-like [Diadema setosum]|uniref:solute carrier organic anion transporter family member 3A1-like n=1 Tax=Diadema setosum TaxID=31175 RepID=UPI003B3B4183
MAASSSHNRCLTPMVFTVILGANCFIYISIIGPFGTAILTSIQREFQLKSSEAGILFSINDIVGLIAITPIAYIGNRHHRPRILGVSALIMAFGCLLSALPQFIGNDPALPAGGSPDLDGNDTVGETPLSQYYQQIELCKAVGADSTQSPDDGVCSAEELSASGSQFNRATWIIVGQVFIGIGSSGLFTLGVTHLDDGVSKKSTSVFFAGLFTVLSLAPIAAFAISGFCLSLHTDFYKIDVDELGYGDKDPRWIGAWWLGYIIFGVLLVLNSIPFFFFPKEWPKKERDMELKDRTFAPSTKEDDDAANTSEIFLINSMKEPSLSESGCMGYAKGYFTTLFRLTVNLTYMILITASVSDSAMFAGFFSFLGRYLLTQYEITPAMVSILLGAVTSPGALLGNLIGGLVVKKFRLDTKGVTRLVVIIAFVNVIVVSFFFTASCPTRPIAGVTVPYPDGSSSMIGSSEEPACLSDCGCTDGVYIPVCGSDGLTYISPCHAGCATVNEGSAPNTYSQCRCVGESQAAQQRMGNLAAAAPGVSTNASYVPMATGYPNTSSVLTAVQEKCPGYDCSSKQYTFLALLAVMIFLFSMSHVPGFMLFMRCVEERDRAVAIGVSSLLGRVLASIPAPIYFGAAIQTTCLMFQESCGQTGNCFIYDNIRLSNVIFSLLLVLKMIAFLGYFCCYLSLRRDSEGKYKSLVICEPKEEDWKPKETTV